MQRSSAVSPAEADAAAGGEHAGEKGCDDAGDAPEILPDGWIADAPAAETAALYALDRRGEGADSACFLLDDQHRHRAGRDAAAGGAGVEVVRGADFDFSSLDHADGLRFIAGDSLEEEGAHDALPVRTAHGGEFDLRPGMQDRVGLHSRNHLAGAGHPGQDGARFDKAAERFGIGSGFSGGIHRKSPVFYLN